MNLPTPLQIAKAWHGVDSVWLVRRNKANEHGKQWEVVFDDGDMHVMGRYGSQFAAEIRANRLSDLARGEAVRKLIREMQQT